MVMFAENIEFEYVMISGERDHTCGLFDLICGSTSSNCERECAE
jgi:hypothetical protein